MIRHIKRWNIWRKRNTNSWFHKLLVLLSLRYSPTLNEILLPEDYDDLITIFKDADNTTKVYAYSYLNALLKRYKED